MTILLIWQWFSCCRMMMTLVMKRMILMLMRNILTRIYHQDLMEEVSSFLTYSSHHHHHQVSPPHCRLAVTSSITSDLWFHCVHTGLSVSSYCCCPPTCLLHASFPLSLPHPLTRRCLLYGRRTLLVRPISHSVILSSIPHFVILLILCLLSFHFQPQYYSSSDHFWKPPTLCSHCLNIVHVSAPCKNVESV